MGKRVGWSILIGSLILAVADAAWVLLALSIPPSDLVALSLWVALPIAAFVTAHLAPRHKVLVGLAVVLPAALLLAITNAIFDVAVNHSAFSGVGATFRVALRAVPFGALLCAIGAALGFGWSKLSPHA